MSTPPGTIILSRSNPSMIRPSVRDGQATFFWTTPLTDGGDPITGYTLIDNVHSIQSNYGSSTFSATITGLTNGTPYPFEVYATNSLGDGPSSAFRTIEPGFRPDVPQSPSVSTINGSKAYVTWTAPSSDGGAAIGWYVVKSESSNLSNAVVKFSTKGTTFERYVTGLTAGETYRFSIQAVNDPGYSPKAYTSYITMPSIVTAGLNIWLSAPEYAGTGTWYDKTSNGYNATLEDGKDFKNLDGNGVVLDGGTSYIVPYFGSYSNFTISTWFKRTGLSDQGGSIFTQIFTGTTVNMAIYSGQYGPSDTQFSGGFFNGSWQNGTPYTFPLNTWVNMVVTWDGTNIKTYINNSLYDTTPSVLTAYSANPNNYRIGRRWDNASYITGELGELLVYDRAITAGEVSSNYTASAGIFI